MRIMKYVWIASALLFVLPMAAQVQLVAAALGPEMATFKQLDTTAAD